MEKKPEGPAVGISFSVQNDGELIGIHFDLPMSTFVVGVPLGIAEKLSDPDQGFSAQLSQVLKVARKGNPLFLEDK